MKKYWKLIVGLVLSVLFVVFTILVKFVDVSAIGPNGSEVGFATLNEMVMKQLPLNKTLYDVSEIMTIIPFVICGVFAVCGLIQLIKTKSFKKVDPILYVLAASYIVAILLFFLFEIFVINYRPHLIDGELEASYPSSHTMVGISVMLSTIVMINYYLKGNQRLKVAKYVIEGDAILLLVMTIILRVFSGAHWISDIIASFISSFAIFFLFWHFYDKVKALKK